VTVGRLAMERAPLRDVTISSDHDVYLLLGRNCYTVAGEVIA
jgi:hypothetical protein